MQLLRDEAKYIPQRQETANNPPLKTASLPYKSFAFLLLALFDVISFSITP